METEKSQSQNISLLEWNHEVYKDLKGVVNTETARTYSYNKAMGPDRITEIGFR